jgi:hypothetical protein
MRRNVSPDTPRLADAARVRPRDPRIVLRALVPLKPPLFRESRYLKFRLDRTEQTSKLASAFVDWALCASGFWDGLINRRSDAS